MVFRDFVAPPKQNLQLCITMNIVHLTNKALFKVVKAHYTPLWEFEMTGTPSV